MNITNIIGKGKPFEPPFFTDDDGMYIFDKNSQMVLETRGYGHLQYLYKDAEIYDVYTTLAQHICDLLNKEHNKSKSQRMCLKDKNKICDDCHDCDIESDAWDLITGY